MKMNRWKKFAIGLFAGIFGAGGMILYLLVRDYFELQLPPWPVFVLSFFAALVVSVTVHELGHVLAGFWVKYQFFFVSVGPFKLEKKSNGIKKVFDLKTPNLYGGLTLMLPTEANDSRHRAAVFIAGGPVASVLLFVLLTTTAFSLSANGSTLWLPNAVIYFSWLTAVVSLFLGLFALIPEDSGQIKSDGYHLLDIWKGGEAFLTSRIITRLMSQSLQGTRPAGLDAGLMHRLLETGDSLESQIGRLFLFSYYSDKGDMDEAGVYLDAAAEMTEQVQNPALDPSIFLEKAFWEVLNEGTTEKAEHYFEKGKTGYAEKSTFNRSQTALFFIQGRRDEARKAAATTRRLIRESVDRGGAVWEEDMLDRLLLKFGEDKRF